MTHTSSIVLLRLPQCTIVMFDPTPQAGPNPTANASQIPDLYDYKETAKESLGEHHSNIWMHHIGIADSDRVGRFDNHFVKGNGVKTAFLSLRSAIALHQHVLEATPAFLKLDVEGYEFNLIDQLLALRIPNLGVDFHTWDVGELRIALLKFELAGYDVLAHPGERDEHDFRSAASATPRPAVVLAASPTVQLHLVLLVLLVLDCSEISSSFLIGALRLALFSVAKGRLFIHVNFYLTRPQTEPTAADLRHLDPGHVPGALDRDRPLTPSRQGHSCMCVDDWPLICHHRVRHRHLLHQGCDRLGR